MDNPPDEKVASLRRSGTLHPHPDRVLDELFTGNEFFDARDALQVKYEMVRRVTQDGWPVSQASRRYGVSRPSFYRAQAALEEGGLVGLVPERRGPRGAHKLTGEVMAFVEGQLAEGLTLTEVLTRVQEQFGLRVHRRSLERRRASGKKNGGK